MKRGAVPRHAIFCAVSFLAMLGVLPIGPYRRYILYDGTELPWYIIPFDRKGRCEGPETLRALLGDVRAGSFTDIYVFSHGWNNDWSTATARYHDFLDGYSDLRRDLRLVSPSGYKPLLVGIFWPSTALVEEEEQPQFAGNSELDAATANGRQAIEELAACIPDDNLNRFYALLQKPELDQSEAHELAETIHSAYIEQDDDLPGLPRLSPEDMLKAWPAKEEELNLDEILPAPGAASRPQAAFDGYKHYLPRDLIRAFTVRQMKDRAGVVGANGVAPLLKDLLSTSQPRLHLIGHSYGCRLLLSATCYPDSLGGTIASMLLLQPAVSHLCFADQVKQTGKPGGYRTALERVRAPILSTFSSHDFPLTRLFHWALWRDRDLAEARVAANEPPSIYAALGGFGPRQSGEQIIDVCDPGDFYQLDSGPRLFGVNASRTIAGHGKISNLSTWWALYNLVKWNWEQHG